MKMIIRADDVGFSPVCNIGSFEAIDAGLVTSVDVMLDCPGTVDALERLTKYPWLSIGWHMHMWGAPVLPVEQVPSLVEQEGEFKGRFRSDLAQAGDVVFEEALEELRAQINRCIDILGKAPDVGGGGKSSSAWGRACKQVSDEFGIVYNFASKEATDPRVQEKILAAQKAGAVWAQHYPTEPRPATMADPKWADRKIMIADGTFAYIDLLTDSVAEVEATYDPVLYYTEDRAHLLEYPEDAIVQQAWHPGYVDYYVYRLGERARRPRAQQFIIGRTQDVAALCDSRLKAWIVEHKIELVNTRDALYGTKEFQNHLKRMGSDLAVE